MILLHLIGAKGRHPPVLCMQLQKITKATLKSLLHLKSDGLWNKDKACLLQVDGHFEFQICIKRLRICDGNLIYIYIQANQHALFGTGTYDDEWFISTKNKKYVKDYSMNILPKYGSSFDKLIKKKRL